MICTKKPENVRGGALSCHKLTIYKQFSSHKFINVQSIKYTQKKLEKPGKAGLLTSLINLYPTSNFVKKFLISSSSDLLQTFET